MHSAFASPKRFGALFDACPTVHVMMEDVIEYGLLVLERRAAGEQIPEMHGGSGGTRFHLVTGQTLPLVSDAARSSTPVRSDAVRVISPRWTDEDDRRQVRADGGVPDLVVALEDLVGVVAGWLERQMMSRLEQMEPQELFTAARGFGILARSH